MKTLKFRLKRKLSGKAIKQAKRVRLNKQLHINRLYERNVNKNWLREGKTGRRKYPPALYEESYISIYQAQKLAKEFKKEGKFGKLKRLYKIQPAIDPKVIKQREHEEKVRIWQAKLKLNEKCQSLR